MSQIWNRIKRIARSYVHDSPLYSYETLEEEDQRRLKEIIDQLNRRPSQEQNSAPHGAQQQEHRTRAGDRNGQQQQQRRAPSGPTLDSSLAVLGLPPKATDEEIKKAYKQLMLKYHPDRVASLSAVEQQASHRRAQEINAAYQFIKQARNL